MVQITVLRWFVDSYQVQMRAWNSLPGAGTNQTVGVTVSALIPVNDSTIVAPQVVATNSSTLFSLLPVAGKLT